MSNSIITNTHPNLTRNRSLSFNRIATIALFRMTLPRILGPLIAPCQPPLSRTSSDTPDPIPSPVAKGTVVGMPCPPHPTPVPVVIHTRIRVGLGTATFERARRARRRDGAHGQRGRAYEAAPLPPGFNHPAPPARPHTSHRQYRNRDRDRERMKDVRDCNWEWECERDRVRDRDRDRDGRRDSGRGYERDGYGEEDEDTGFDEELTHSPAPLQRPISLFDSDEA